MIAALTYGNVPVVDGNPRKPCVRDQRTSDGILKQIIHRPEEPHYPRPHPCTFGDGRKAALSDTAVGAHDKDLVDRLQSAIKLDATIK